MPRPRLLLTVAVLYVAQGLPFGVVAELAPVWLKVRGASLETLGLLTLVGLPWTFKALWAPAVDRLGRAAHWIAASLAVVAVLSAVTPWLSTSWASAALLGIALASATQDVAIDGWTTASTPEPLLGRVNGLRVAAWRGAVLLSGGGAVAAAALLGWRAVFGLAGALALGLALWARGLPARPRRDPRALGSWLRELGAWAARDGSAATAGLVLFVVGFKLGDAAMGPMVKPFWLDSGLSVAEVGLVSITVGTALSVLGALVGGELVTRLGLFTGLWTLGVAQALSNLGYAAAALWPGRPAIYGASVVESFCGGLGTAAFLALLMRLCEGRQAATRFAVLTALAGLGRTLAGALSGFGAARLGYAAYFTLTFALALPAFALLPVVRRRLAESG